MEEYFFPQPDWLLDAIHEKIIPLNGHQVKNDFSTNKSLSLNKNGI
jgi:2-oxoisovalerate dehydrogenase E1 component